MYVCIFDACVSIYVHYKMVQRTRVKDIHDMLVIMIRIAPRASLKSKLVCGLLRRKQPEALLARDPFLGELVVR